MREGNDAEQDARRKAEGLGHKMSPVIAYGDKEYSYCDNPACKARLVVQGDKVEGNALAHVCPLAEGDGRN
jgi:hypothetical protein